MQTAYKYGFQVQEKVDEIAGVGNSYTAGYWQYDSRLGRRWNPDPIVKPWRSSYDAFDNNPINKIDPDGMDDVFMTKDGKTNIVKTKDKFDRNFVDGKQVGENMEQGWGMKTYSKGIEDKSVRVHDLGDEWNREYLKDGDRIVGLAAWKSGDTWSEPGETDNESAATDFNFGVIDLGGGFENSAFYQTIYSDYNPPTDYKGYSLDGNSIGVYPDARTPSGRKDYKELFDLYMGDMPNRASYEPKNMLWKANTSFLYKTSDGQVKRLITLKWGFVVKNSYVYRYKAIETTNTVSPYHMEHLPQDGADLDPNKP